MKESEMTTPAPVDPSRTALLVMDYQPFILGNYPNAADLIERTAEAIAQARAGGLKIVYVRVAFTPQDYAAIPSRNKGFAAIAKAGVLDDGTPEAAIHPDLAPVDGDIVVTKTRRGAFSTTNLANYLHTYGIDSLILAGLSTSGVVLSTVSDASDHDYRILILTDCCDDGRPEVHRVLMEQVFAHQADLIDTKMLPSVLGR
jgi:nicotinamidase-related amidase